MNLLILVKQVNNPYYCQIMAGQWLFPGGGLPPAGQSGKWAIQYICKEEKVKFRTN
jgi:hypothetical protein